MNFNININRLFFGSALMLVTVLGIWAYVDAKSHFAQSCDRICVAHKGMCEDVSAMVGAIRKDTLAVLDEQPLVAALREGNGQIQAMLQLQHAEIEEDFSNLMLWAAVLMVVFLVFSIYSMYKTDDLINQGRNSVEMIKGLSAEAENKISRIDTLFDAESAKLAEQSQRQVSELSDKASEKLSQFAGEVGREIHEAETRINSDIENYNKQMDEKAANMQKQFDDLQGAIVNLLSILNTVSSSERK